MTVERLWELFEEELETGRCGCGCSWDGTRWLKRDNPDGLTWEHTSASVETYLQNHWVHFSAGWKHDGRNPYGSRDGTYVDRRLT